jgi:hypothetical protein
MNGETVHMLAVEDEEAYAPSRELVCLTVPGNRDQEQLR